MDGFVLIDKPAGITSHDVVDGLRRLAGMRRIGHAGTLDPFATGLLILGLGKATKKLGELQGLDKEYEATLELGSVSDTFDREGIIKAEVLRGDIPAPEDIERALDQFRGGYEQLAPLHSAKKIKGQKLYDLARAGKATEDMRPHKQVTIKKIELLEYAWPKLRILVECGSGTYIRSLAHDIGQALGTGAYCLELRRTRIGSYTIDNATALAELTKTGLEQQLLPA